MLVTLIMTSCTATEKLQHTDYREPIAPGARVLLMDTDIECSELTADGKVTAKPAWTAKCKNSVQAALADFLTERKAELVIHDPSAIPAGHAARYREFAKLRETIREAILQRETYPTADDRTNWTMGPGVRSIGDDHNADYALYIHLRDQYETSGHVATRLLFSLFGMAPPGATQQGSVFLHDLGTGNVVWFSNLFSTAGDLRDKQSARKTVDALFQGSSAL